MFYVSEFVHQLYKDDDGLFGGDDREAMNFAILLTQLFTSENGPYQEDYWGEHDFVENLDAFLSRMEDIAVSIGVRGGAVDEIETAIRCQIAINIFVSSGSTPSVCLDPNETSKYGSNYFKPIAVAYTEPNGWIRLSKNVMATDPEYAVHVMVDTDTKEGLYGHYVKDGESAIRHFVRRCTDHTTFQIRGY